mmetsp:Transcript_4539/g.6927  ORF Transcript_4539/g.6927 Transcript_4539/m.6927 type:complete len:334 (-) Transcript_4539:605-1606(-)|eukprot:CAMPEP_0196803120 /NCGR_PEP_ID=MMETSP1362-20130617/2542_1 /TAXON_ID=163516 /ORGANISM="Leptocylindrus danicus, Strain CCMP1856" /LENGTH=333 /DNA_ID=CAMNT_0042174561 /DNA_START=58 /DNA_END=1059 /DNA_ORIENTATION=+
MHRAFLKELLHDVSENFPSLTSIEIGTDGCGPQFRCRKTQTLEALIHDYFPNINLLTHRVAPKGEYKGEHDGQAGLLKGYVRKYPEYTGKSVNSSLEFGGAIRYLINLSKVMGIDYEEMIRNEDEAAAAKPKGGVSRVVLIYCANDDGEKQKAHDFAASNPGVYDAIVEVNRDENFHTEAFEGLNSQYYFESLPSKYHDINNQCALSAKQLFCSCRKSCLPRRQCIARGESYNHLPPCPYVDITGSNFHHVHRKEQRRGKIKLNKREELENKISLIRALKQTDEDKDLNSILIKGTTTNGFNLRAALRAFDPTLEVYKASFNPPKIHKMQKIR